MKFRIGDEVIIDFSDEYSRNSNLDRGKLRGEKRIVTSVAAWSWRNKPVYICRGRNIAGSREMESWPSDWPEDMLVLATPPVPKKVCGTLYG